jgi:hypothetical protein
VVSGLVLVITGNVGPFTTVREKLVGPVEPPLFVAVMASELTAATVGVPVSNPPGERLAHAGRLVPLQVIGPVPVALNW